MNPRYTDAITITIATMSIRSIMISLKFFASILRRSGLLPALTGAKNSAILVMLLSAAAFAAPGARQPGRQSPPTQSNSEAVTAFVKQVEEARRKASTLLAPPRRCPPEAAAAAPVLSGGASAGEGADASPKKEDRDRPRQELLRLMVENGSLSREEADLLNCQLETIDIRTHQKTKQPKCLNPSKVPKELMENAYALADLALKVKDKDVYGYFPRDTQLIAVLQFLGGKNTLLQASTGQGKTLIVAMTAILQHQLKRQQSPPQSPEKTEQEMAVHVITTTDQLVREGLSEKNRKLFKACGITARTMNEPGTSSDIIYGTPFEFEGRALLEATHPNAKLPWRVLDPKVRRTIILDESDSHLIDSASGRVLQSDPDPQAETVKVVMAEIAERVQAHYRLLPDSRSDSRAQRDLHKEIALWVQQAHPDFFPRWEQEGKKWTDNALKVFDPADVWRNGRQFVVRKSLGEERRSLIDMLPHDVALKVVPDLENIRESEKLLKYAQQLKLRGDPRAEDLILKATQHLVDPQMKGLLDKIKKIGEETKLLPALRSHWERLFRIAHNLKEGLGKKGKSLDQILPQVLDGQVQYLSEGTGQIIENMRFKDGIQEFLEYKYLKNILTQPTVSVRSYSMKKYTRGAVVLGLSGTVGLDDSEMMEFQKETWKIQRAVKLPEYAVPQLKKTEKDSPEIHQASETGWEQSVTDATVKHTRTQPVLVIAENPEYAEKLRAKLAESGLKPSLYIEMTDEHVLQKNLGPGDVIVTTNLGGRGSDYKYDEKQAPEGLHVIVAFDSDEERILQQARGRAGRAGNPGTWQKISFGPPLQQKPNLREVRRAVRDTIAADTIFEIYRTLNGIIPDGQPNKDQLTREITQWLSTPDVNSELQRLILSERDPRVVAIKTLDLLQRAGDRPPLEILKRELSKQRPQIEKGLGQSLQSDMVELGKK